MLRLQGRIVVRTVAALSLMLFFVRPTCGQEKRPVKLVGDETLLDQVKVDPKAFVEKPFIMTGGIRVSDYYNYGYDRAEDSHYSLMFRQVLAADKLGSHCHLYLRRAIGKDIVEKILAKTAASDAHLRIRVKVTIADQRYESRGWDLFELLDVQFASDVGDKWGPWVLEEQLAQTLKAQRARKEQELAAQRKAAEQKARIEQERRAARTRTWKDASGKFSVTAEYNGMIGDKVQLKKENGTLLRVPVTSLSQQDRDWLAARRKKK